MTGRKNCLQKTAYALATGIITAVGLCIMLAHSNIYPFGTDSLLFIDLGTQYTDFLLFFKNSSLMEKLYSFHKGFGGPTLGFLSYYALSPFNFIAFLFSDRNAETAVFFIILAKFVFMSLSAYRYFSRHYENLPLNMAFAIAYSFYPFFTRLYYHILWLDCFRLLPLLVLGCEVAVDRKRTGFFTAAFVYALVANYYIAYMCGLFILLYFLYYISKERNTYKEIYDGFCSMAFSAVTAIFLACPVLIPSALQLAEGKLSGHYGRGEWRQNMFYIPQGLSTLFDGTAYYNVPQLAGGRIFVLFLVLFFVNKNISKREKAVSALFYAFMLFSMYNGVVYHIWHGFSPPMDFPYRHSFVYAFLLIMLCRRSVEKADFSDCVKAAVIFVAVYAAVLFIIRGKIALSQYSISVCAVGVIFCFAVFLFMDKNNRQAVTALAAVVIITAVVNGCVYMAAEKSIYSGIYPPEAAGEYKANYTAVTGALEKTADKGFYRVADIAARDYNQPMGAGYYGTNHYSSTFDLNQKQMFVHFGYQDTYYSTIYRHSDVLTDSLFGIKYLLSPDKNSYDSRYILLAEGDKNLYKNPFALPLVYTADTRNVDFSDNGRVHAANMLSALTGYDVLNYDKSTDYAALGRACAEIQANRAEIIKEDGALLEFTAEGSYLLTSIMYDENWHIKVNGRSVRPQKFMEYFIAFPLEDGQCHITMKYIPRGFVPGCVLCVAGIRGIITKEIINKRKKETEIGYFQT